MGLRPTRVFLLRKETKRQALLGFKAWRSHAIGCRFVPNLHLRGPSARSVFYGRPNHLSHSSKGWLVLVFCSKRKSSFGAPVLNAGPPSGIAVVAFFALRSKAQKAVVVLGAQSGAGEARLLYNSSGASLRLICKGLKPPKGGFSPVATPLQLFYSKAAQNKVLRTLF